MAETFTMILVLNEADYAAVQKEIAYRQRRGDTGILPEGDSNLAGAHLAEAIRDLDDYRALFDVKHPPGTELDDA